MHGNQQHCVLVTQVLCICITHFLIGKMYAILCQIVKSTNIPTHSVTAGIDLIY